MKEALTLHLKGMLEDGLELPQPQGLLFYLSQGEPIAEPDNLLTYVEIRSPATA